MVKWIKVGNINAFCSSLKNGYTGEVAGVTNGNSDQASDENTSSSTGNPQLALSTLTHFGTEKDGLTGVPPKVKGVDALRSEWNA